VWRIRFEALDQESGSKAMSPDIVRSHLSCDSVVTPMKAVRRGLRSPNHKSYDRLTEIADARVGHGSINIQFTLQTGHLLGSLIE